MQETVRAIGLASQSRAVLPMSARFLTLAMGLIVAAASVSLVFTVPGQRPPSSPAVGKDSPEPTSEISATPDTTSLSPMPSPTDGRLPNCSSTSFGATGTESQPDTAALSEYGQRHADEFGGLYWDSADVLVMSFTDRVPEHEQAVRPLAPSGVELRVRQVTNTYDDLVAIVNRISDAMVAGDLSEVHAAGPSARLNKVLLEVSTSDPAIRDRLEARFGDGVLEFCVSQVPVVGPSF